MFDTSFSSSPAKPLQQHAHFIAAVNAAGGHASRIGPLDSVVLRRRMMGVPVAMLPRLVGCAEFVGHAKRHLRSAGLFNHFVLISPDAPCPSLAKLGAMPLMTPATVAELDLDRAPEERRAAMHKKWRNRLHKAQGAGLRVSVETPPSDRLHSLLARDATQAKARGYRAWPHALTLAYAVQNPGQVVLLTAYQGRTNVAEVLLLIHGSTATYHVGHISPLGKTLCAHNLLMDHAATWLAGHGVRRLDLGMIDSVSSPGLARFKLGMGAQSRRLGGTWGWWPRMGRGLGVLARLDRAKMM